MRCKTKGLPKRAKNDLIRTGKIGAAAFTEKALHDMIQR